MRAAQAVAVRAQYGVLLVAGADFTQPAYIDRLAPLGVRFVRLALTPEVFADQKYWLAYVERIKANGMIASINLMQTAAVPVKLVAAGAAVAAQHGTDWFYVVDSFGGMQPNQVQEYIRAIGDASGMITGLHAHNNGGMAVANSLAAVAAGARLVDSTQQGIGRATGNPATEVLLLALQQLGHETEIDTEAVMALGELARPLFAEKGNDPTYFVSGSAGIHSRALPSARKAASGAGRSVREFLLRLGQEAVRRGLSARDVFSDEVFRTVLEATPRQSQRVPTAAMVRRVGEALTRDSRPELRAHAESVFVNAIKSRRTGVLHLVDADTFPFAGPLPWESRDLVGLSVPVRRGSIAALTERVPEIVVIDPELAGWPGIPRSARTLMLPYASLLTDAVVSLASALRADAPVWVAAASGLEAVRAGLRARGCPVEEREPSGERRVIISDGDRALLERLRAGDRVITLQSGPERVSFVDLARKKGAVVLVPPIGPALAGWVYAQLAAAQLAKSADLAPSLVGALRLVTPGVAAGSGELVVDATDCPARVVDATASQGALPVEALALLRATALLNGRPGL